MRGFFLGAGAASSGAVIELVGASLNTTGNELTITHSRAVEPLFFDYTSFALTLASGRSVTILDMTLDGADIVLILNSPVYSSDTVTIAYTKPASNPIKDLGDNEIATYSGQAVTNSSTIVGPAAILDADLVEGWDESSIQESAAVVTSVVGLFNGFDLTPDGSPGYNTGDTLGTFGPRGPDEGLVHCTDDVLYNADAGLGDLVAGSDSGAFSLVYAFRFGNLANSQVICAWDNVTGGTGYWYIFTDSGDDISMRWRDDSGQSTFKSDLTGGFTDNLIHYMVVSYAGAGGALTIDIDGTEVHSSTVGGTGTVGAFSPTRFCLGGGYLGDATPNALSANDFYFRECWVGSATLSSGQRANFNAYLAAKYSNPRTPQHTATRAELINTSTTNAPPNVMHPCIVRAASWHTTPPGTYLMWFGDHDGEEIYYAYSNTLTSGWAVDATGTDWTLANLWIASGESNDGDQHLSSPHVVVDDVNERYVGFAHHKDTSGHNSHCAVSTDGVSWTFLNSGANLVATDPDGRAQYLRPFLVGSTWYALSNRCMLLRSTDPDGETGYVYATDVDKFNGVATADGNDILHAHAHVEGTTLTVYYTRISDVPARVRMSTVDASGDWQDWQMQTPVELFETDNANDWEGGTKPYIAAPGGVQSGSLREIRDPQFFRDSDDSEWIVYAGRGEGSIGIAQTAAAP